MKTEGHVELNLKPYTRTNAASLEIHMSWWGMTNLEEGDTQYSIEQKVERIAEAGFNGINGFIPSPEEEQLWNQLLDRYNLSLSVNAYPKTIEDMTTFLVHAKQYGRIQHINVQVMTPFLIDEPAIDFIRRLHVLSDEAGIPAYIETHRGTITQDLLRTISYIEALDQLRLTIDLSHYVVAGELHTITEEAELYIQKLLGRTSAIHARVSNGEQIQVDVGASGEHPMLQHFERWWKSGMQQWLNSVANKDKVFPFVVELGPPPYAITTDESKGRLHEIGNRWEQALFFKQLAGRIWSEVNR